jgi:hypothetical protein
MRRESSGYVIVNDLTLANQVKNFLGEVYEKQAFIGITGTFCMRYDYWLRRR